MEHYIISTYSEIYITHNNSLLKHVATLNRYKMLTKLKFSVKMRP